MLFSPITCSATVHARGLASWGREQMPPPRNPALISKSVLSLRLDLVNPIFFQTKFAKSLKVMSVGFMQ
jgi:hypothetical protein